MRLSLRSYPYPVVGNRDDVPGAAFQAALEMTSDKEQVYVSVSINCSSATINKLISAGAAKFVLHLECTNTLFRRAYEFSKSSTQISIPVENLNDAVEANVFVCAAKKISDYRVDKAHSDYGNSSFEVKPGEVLAISEGHIFYIESNFDSLSRIGSIMQVQESSESGDSPMRIDCNLDKIVVILSKNDFKDYKQLKSYESVAGPLTTTIVLPVLVEALHILKEEGAGDEDRRRWVRALTRRIEQLGIESENDFVIKAQKLLELPIRRSLSAARQLAEASA